MKYDSYCRTKTGGDIIFSGHHPQVPVEPIEYVYELYPEKEKKNTADGEGIEGEGGEWWTPLLRCFSLYHWPKQQHSFLPTYYYYILTTRDLLCMQDSSYVDTLNKIWPKNLKRLVEGNFAINGPRTLPWTLLYHKKSVLWKMWKSWQPTLCLHACWPSHTLSKASRLMDLCGSSVSQHPTHHVAVLFIPDVVTHRPPAALMENLHTTFMRTWPVHQPHKSLLHCNTPTYTSEKLSAYTYELEEAFKNMFCLFNTCRLHSTKCLQQTT